MPVEGIDGVGADARVEVALQAFEQRLAHARAGLGSPDQNKSECRDGNPANPGLFILKGGQEELGQFFGGERLDPRARVGQPAARSDDPQGQDGLGSRGRSWGLQGRFEFGKAAALPLPLRRRVFSREGQRAEHCEASAPLCGAGMLAHGLPPPPLFDGTSEGPDTPNIPECARLTKTTFHHG